MPKIDKGIPAPVPRSKSIPEMPLHIMEIGDSFLAAVGVKHNSVRSLACVYGRTSGKKFSCKREGADGLRVWRTA